MRKNVLLLGIAAFAAVTLPGCSSDDTPAVNSNQYPEGLNLTVDERIELNSSISGSYDLIDEFAKQSGSGNLVVSPLSLTYALAMSANFLSDEQGDEIVAHILSDRESLQSLNKTLQTVSSSISHNCKSSKLTLANSLWTCSPERVNEIAQATLEKYYDAPCFTADLQTPAGATVVNNWISDHTFGLIKDFYEPTNADVLLLNTLYYAGDWLKKFDKPVDSPFTNHNGTVKMVPTMKGKQSIAYSKNELGEYLFWNFDNTNVSFVVFFPAENNIDNISFKMLQQKDPSKLVRGSSTISMPEFKLNESKFLKEILKSQGIVKIFDHSYDYYISDIKQQVVVDVNYKGAEAAAVTGSMIVTEGSPDEKPEVPDHIIINRPFLFEIDAYNIPIITGRVSEL